MDLLTQLEHYLVNEVSPLRTEINANPDMLKKAFDEFKHTFFALYFRDDHLLESEHREVKVKFQSLMGKYAGALGFLQGQSSIPINFIKSSNSKIKVELLDRIKKGDLTIGNSTYYLKHMPRNIPRGKKVNGGFVVDGTIPLASGFQLFDLLLFCFINENNDECFAVIEFKTDQRYFKIDFTYEMEVMNSLNTVQISLNKFFISDEMVMAKSNSGEFIRIYLLSPPYAYTLGVAKRSIEIAKNRARDGVSNLVEKLDEVESKVITLENKLIKGEGVSFPMLINYSFMCINSCMLSVGGVSVAKNSELNCLMNELAVWSMPAVSSDFIDDLFSNLINNSISGD